MNERITSHMRVWPRRGIFAITPRIMPLALAARIHRVPLGRMLRELNACADREDV